ILGIRDSAKKHLIKTIKSLNEDIKDERNLADSSNKIKKESKQKSVKTNIDANREYVDALEKFKKEVGTDDIVSVTPSQLGLAKKAKQKDQDLLKLDEEDLKHIKNLREKVVKPTKTTAASVVNKKSTPSKTR
ncbi:delta-aminolevulinic acid dehydratase, partial [Rickettsia endosymbiont of Ixodes scapularis]